MFGGERIWTVCEAEEDQWDYLKKETINKHFKKEIRNYKSEKSGRNISNYQSGCEGRNS